LQSGGSLGASITEMNKKVIIVEDEFIVADDLRLTLEAAGNVVSGIASSVEQARELVKRHKPGMALLDIHLKGKLTGIDFAKELRQEGIPFIYLSAYSNQAILEAAKATQPYGFLVKPFRDKDVLVAVDIARYRHENSVDSLLRKEQTLMRALTDINDASGSDADKLLQTIKAIQPYVPFDYLAIGKKTSGDIPYKWVGFLRLGLKEYQVISVQQLLMISGMKMEELERIRKTTADEKKTGWFNGDDFDHIRLINPFKDLLARTFTLTSNLTITFPDKHGDECYFSFFSRSREAYHADHIALLEGLYNLLIHATEYIYSNRKEPVLASSQTNEIIGNDPGLSKVLDQALQVAPFDTSVLILGETGTGKEKMAHFIHEHSQRAKKPFIKINCAVLPPTLVESELFGHEKGSFTGALEKRIGKFEQAHGGSIFLDEIGELPLDLQVKLLRVLQEKEIERIGGDDTIKVDVRMIVATNRVLEKEVAEGRFRMDLYYRLNVFPLLLPPLRERQVDIPLLAEFFGRKFCKKVNKNFHGISSQMLDSLKQFQWPGNVRELENVIEQSVILNDGLSDLVLRKPLFNSFATATKNISESGENPQNLDDIKKIQSETERVYIISIMKKANGRIRGQKGAARMLNIPASTLESRIIKLGIKKGDYR
jgi:DNA-binding NtrC family response regulator